MISLYKRRLAAINKRLAEISKRQDELNQRFAELTTEMVSLFGKQQLDMESMNAALIKMLAALAYPRLDLSEANRWAKEVRRWSAKLLIDTIKREEVVRERDLVEDELDGLHLEWARLQGEKDDILAELKKLGLYAPPDAR